MRSHVLMSSPVKREVCGMSDFDGLELKRLILGVGNMLLICSAWSLGIGSGFHVVRVALLRL